MLTKLERNCPEKRMRPSSSTRSPRLATRFSRLSTRTPKSDDEPLLTCFLRTVGNRVSDIIEVETSDFVRIHVRTSYSVTFQREHRERWFNCENYIQVMCDHLRSIVRSRMRTMPLSALWPQVSQLSC